MLAWPVYAESSLCIAALTLQVEESALAVTLSPTLAGCLHRAASLSFGHRRVTFLTASPSLQVMDGNVITAKRTAAVSAIATKVRPVVMLC